MPNRDFAIGCYLFVELPSGVDCHEKRKPEQSRPASESSGLVGGNRCFVEPETVADSDNRGRVLKHRREHRERQHLLVADQHGRTLMIDLDNAGTIDSKGNAEITKRSP